MTPMDADFPNVGIVELDSPAGRAILGDPSLNRQMPPAPPQQVRQGTPTHTREDVVPEPAPKPKPVSLADIRELDLNFPDIPALLPGLKQNPESGVPLLKYVRDTESRINRDAATVEANRAASARRAAELVAEVQARHGVSSLEEIEQKQSEYEERIRRACEVLYGRLPAQT